MTNQYVTVEASGAEGQANLNLWLKDLSAYCPGVHRSVMKRQLVLACREFFQQSWAWRASMGPINIVAGQNVYDLSPFNAYTDVVGVINVTLNGVPLPPLNQRPPPEGNPPGTATPTSDAPWGYYMVGVSIIAVYPTPAKNLAQAMQVYCALRPKQSVKQVPAIAVTNYYDAIMDGALYRLLQQPAKPYSNPALAAYYEGKFRTAIGQYAAEAKKGYNNGVQWTFPYFGGRRNGSWL